MSNPIERVRRLVLATLIRVTKVCHEFWRRRYWRYGGLNWKIHIMLRLYFFFGGVFIYYERCLFKLQFEPSVSVTSEFVTEFRNSALMLMMLMSGRQCSRLYCPQVQDQIQNVVKRAVNCIVMIQDVPLWQRGLRRQLVLFDWVLG